MTRKIVLTGDRPTGPLHLGHYVGSLKNRLQLQQEHEQFIMIADVQALTDNADNPEKVRDNILEVALDYLAVGIDPSQTTIFLQSRMPVIPELTMYYLNLVTVAQLERNPTVKEEIKLRGFERNIPAGFFVYPVNQAADITCVDADLVPVGRDQLPMIELASDIVRRFNRIYGETLKEPKALLPKNELEGRLPGIDGKAKMSKSLKNAIFLSDSADDVKKKVMSMYTDPDHIRVEDPGKIEGNTVFSYLDIFGSDQAAVAEMKAHYQRGGLGDVKVKRYLEAELQAVLEPIRQKRAEYAADKGQVMQIIEQGTERAQKRAAQTLARVREAMKLL